MRADLLQWRPLAVTIGIRPRTYRRLIRVAGAVIVVGAAAITAGALPVRPDVRLAADRDHGPAFTVGLSAFDGAAPFDSHEGPGRDTGPSNGIVREGDPVTYVVDVGVGEFALRDVEFELPVPRGFSAPFLPEYCRDGSGFYETDVDETVLRCRAGDLDAQRYFTRTVTMIAGPPPETEGLPITVRVSVDGGVHRMRSGGVTVRVTTAAAGVCDPFGVPTPGLSPQSPSPHEASASNTVVARLRGDIGAEDLVTQQNSVEAVGRVSGQVTDGTAEAVSLDGTDRCGHVIARTVTPFDGHFSFLGLVPGTYRVTVDGRAPIIIDLTPGAIAVDGLTF